MIADLARRREKLKRLRMEAVMKAIGHAAMGTANAVEEDIQRDREGLSGGAIVPYSLSSSSSSSSSSLAARGRNRRSGRGGANGHVEVDDEKEEAEEEEEEEEEEEGEAGVRLSRVYGLQRASAALRAVAQVIGVEGANGNGNTGRSFSPFLSLSLSLSLSHTHNLHPSLYNDHCKRCIRCRRRRRQRRRRP
tara:strand:+ start:339 stop:914 length:576 start_codon:yes stop_codon:yes gene_type:complete